MGQTASRDGSAPVSTQDSTLSTLTSSSVTSSSAVTASMTSPLSRTPDDRMHNDSPVSSTQDVRDVKAEAGPSSKPYRKVDGPSAHAATSIRPTLTSRPSLFRRRRHSKLSIDSLPSHEQPQMRKRFLRSASSPPNVVNGSTDTAMPTSHAEASTLPKRGLLSRIRARRMVSSPSVSSALRPQSTHFSSGPMARRSSISQPNMPTLVTEITPSHSQKEASRSLAHSETVQDTEPPDVLAAAIFTPANDATYPMTPPPESDVLLAERERVRSLIEAALHARPLPAPIDDNEAIILETDGRSRTAEDNTDANGLDLATFLAARLALPASTPASESDGDVQMLGAEATEAQAVPSSPRPTTESLVNAPVVESRDTASQGSHAPLAAPIPRRILVQGIVARAASRAPSRPGGAVSASIPDLVRHTGESDDVNRSNIDIPPMDATETDVAPAAPAHDVADSSWTDAVNELLNMRSDEEQTSPGTAQADESDFENAMHQAVLIGRLLSIAAAATAATLLPGSIRVNGSVVSGFDDDATTLPFGSPAPAASPGSPAPDSSLRNRARSGSLPTRSRSIAPFRGRELAAQADEAQGPMEPRRSAGHSRGDSGSGSSGTLQDVLRNALAAAFGSGNLLRNRLETEPETPASSAQSPMPTSPVVGSQAQFISNPSDQDIMSTTSPLASPSLPSPSGPAPAVSIQVSSLEQDPRLTNARDAPEGSFERFLSDLQTGVSSAIIQTHRTSAAMSEGIDSASALGIPALPDASVSAGRDSAPVSAIPLQSVAPPISQPQTRSERPTSMLVNTLNRNQHPFAYFRSFRFPARPFSEIPPDSRSSGIPLSNSAEPDMISDEAPIAPPALGSAQNVSSFTPSAGHAPAAGSATTVPAASTSYVPMILVGIRSMQPPTFTTSTSEAGISDNASASQEASAVSTDDQSPTRVQGTETAAAVASRAVHSGSSAMPSNSQMPDEGLSGYVLWIMGGVYPANHPVVLAPSLLSDAALTYEDMMRLAEMLGQHKPPTASKEELAASDLQVIKAVGLRTMVEEAKVLPITAERCLICLEDYDDAEDVRILHCQHCFHQGCVDRWLSDSANTCPVCRTAGVRRGLDEAATSTAMGPAPAGASTSDGEDIEMQA